MDQECALYMWLSPREWNVTGLRVLPGPTPDPALAAQSGGWIPAAPPVPHEPLHLKLLQIPSELLEPLLAGALTGLHCCHNSHAKRPLTPPPCPSLYYGGLVL